jgi:hypothetical protein
MLIPLFYKSSYHNTRKNLLFHIYSSIISEVFSFATVGTFRGGGVTPTLTALVL